MRLSLVAFSLAGLLIADVAQAQQQNHPNADLVVNANSVGTFPLHSLMGQSDPAMIAVNGQPNAMFFILFGQHDDGTNVPGLGTLHIKLSAPFGMLQGTLDATGHDQIFLPPGSLATAPLGAKFTFQALVADTSIGLGFRPSGATKVDIVETMSAPVSVSPGVNSQVKARAPMTSVTANTVSIGNLAFRLSANTQFDNFNQLSQLKVGDFLAIEGFYNAQGLLEAEQVGLEDWQPEARLKGLVQSTGPSAISLLGVTVYVATSSTFTDAGQPATAAQILPGSIVEVRIPVAAMFPNITSGAINLSTEAEPEPEDVPEEEQENESPPPSFCS